MKIYIIGSLKKEHVLNSLTAEQFLSLLSQKQFIEERQAYFDAFKKEEDAKKYLEFFYGNEDQTELAHYMFTIEGDESTIKGLLTHKHTDELHNNIDTQIAYLKINVNDLQLMLNKAIVKINNSFDATKEENKIAEYQKKIEAKQLDLQSTQDQIKKYNYGLHQVEDELSKVDQGYGKIQQQIEEKKDLIIKLRQKIWNISILVDTLKEEIKNESINTNSEQVSTNSKIAEHIDSLKLAIDKKNRVDQKIANIKQEIKEKEKQQNPLIEQALNLFEVLSEIDKVFEIKEIQENVIKEEIEQYNNNVSQLMKEVHKKQDEVVKAKQKLTSFTKIRKAQQEDLLLNYFESALNDNKVENTRLLNEVCKHIPAKDFQGLFYGIYDRLNTNKRFDLDKNTSELEIASRKINQKNIADAIKTVITNYHKEESRQAKRSALISTLIFCAGIVTIPFSVMYYKRKLKELDQKRTFQSTPVKIGEPLNRFRKVKPSNESTAEVILSCVNLDYPRVDKDNSNQVSSEPKNLNTFKDVLFNGNHLRKTSINLQPRRFEGGQFFQSVKMIGTKEQIEKKKQKEEARNSLKQGK